MTTGKTVSLTRQTFVGKVICLLFNMPSWLAITFLPRSKLPLISWLKSPSAVILEPQNIKYAIVSIASSSICHELMGLGKTRDLFKKIRVTKGTLHAKIDTIKTEIVWT